MGIRSLTEQLFAEAEEARKRRGFVSARAPSRSAPEAPASPLRQSGTTILYSRKRPIAPLRPPDELRPTAPPPPPASAGSTGIRDRTQPSRWKPPGGIAARFGIHAPKPRQDEAPGPAAGAESAAGRASANGGARQAEGRPAAVSPALPKDEGAVEPVQEAAGPITIELQSH